MKEKENAVIINGKKYVVQKMHGLGQCDECDLGDEHPSCGGSLFCGNFCSAFEYYFEYEWGECYCLFQGGKGMKGYGNFKGDVLYQGTLKTNRGIVESDLEVLRKYMNADGYEIKEVEIHSDKKDWEKRTWDLAVKLYTYSENTDAEQAVRYAKDLVEEYRKEFKL